MGHYLDQSFTGSMCALRTDGSYESTDCMALLKLIEKWLPYRHGVMWHCIVDVCLGICRGIEWVDRVALFSEFPSV